MPKNDEKLRQSLLRTIEQWMKEMGQEPEINDKAEISGENGRYKEVINKTVFSVKELADYLGVSTDSIYTMVRENQLPHVRVRRRILFHRDVINDWMKGENCTTGPQDYS